MNRVENKWKFQGNWIKGKEYDYGDEDALYYIKNQNIVLEKEFHIETIEECYLYVAVLGYYIAYINGVRLGNFELNSDWTNYQKCIYYDKYDVTSYLHVGLNKIEFELGNGMYNPAPLKLLGKYNLRNTLNEIGQPRLICDVLNNEEILVKTDSSWKYRLGNRIFNNLYLGESVDNTFFSNNKYDVELEIKERNFEKSYIPKIIRHNNVRPKDIKITKEGIIYDFGEMISGFINFSWVAEYQQEVTLKYSENMKNKRMDYSTCLVGSVGEQRGDFKVDGGKGSPEKAIQTDRIISSKGKNSFINKFSYHSFRYVCVTGIEEKYINDIQAIYVYTDIEKTGNIKLDHSFLNKLYEAGVRTKLNNIHSVFEDCARERLGYGGDIVALAPSNLYMFDVNEMYKKVINDFIYDQTESGGVSETAPYMGIQTNGTKEKEGPILWQLVLPFLLYKHAQFYGELEFIKTKFKYSKKQLDYLLSYESEELAKHCIGDHGSVLISGNFKQATPDKEFIGYCTILLFLKYNIFLGSLLDIDMASYELKYNELKELTVQNFLNEDGTFGEGTQSGLAFATVLELIDGETVCKKLVKKIEQDHFVFNSGIFGMMFSYEMLNKYGYDEVIEKWLTRKDEPNFAHMLSTGNKALSELFVGEHQSLNHAMFASYQQWYYQGLAGIKIDEKAIGFNKCVIKPYFSKIVNSCECSIVTKHGIIESTWFKKEDLVTWKVTLPNNLKDTEVTIPKDYVMIDEISNNDGTILIHLRKN